MKGGANHSDAPMSCTNSRRGEMWFPNQTIKEQLYSKYETLSSNPSTTKKKKKCSKTIPNNERRRGKDLEASGIHQCKLWLPNTQRWPWL
jgi:hypothetical protein